MADADRHTIENDAEKRMEFMYDYGDFENER